MSKGALIGRGRTAEIYAWGPDKVVKLYFDEFPANWVKHEDEVSRQVAAVGAPAPAYFGMVKSEGRTGLIFERLPGPTMLTALRTRLWAVDCYARLMAELQYRIHSCPSPDLPAVKDSLQWSLQEAPSLPERFRQAALQALAQLPSGEALCHFDFHPDNIILTPRGPVVIDWLAAGRAHPLADVARTSLLLSIGEPPPGTPRRAVIHLLRQYLHNTYLKHYFHLNGMTPEQLQAWKLPVTAARMAEGIENEREKLLSRLAALVPN